MKIRLLVTTALVGAAFAMPAMAAVFNHTYEGNQGTVAVEGETSNSTWDSSVIYVPGEASVGENSVFKNNHSGLGGAIAIRKQTGQLEIGQGSVFEGNKADYDGGAIGNYGGAVIAENVKFFNNEAGLLADSDSNQIGGGAISLGIDATTTIKSSTFDGNISHFNGGAIATRRTLSGAETGESNSFVVENSVFSNNLADGSDVQDTANAKEFGGNGGAIANTFATTEISNTTFLNNQATGNGGAIFNNKYFGIKDKTMSALGGEISLADTTFSGNAADADGGAIYNSANATINLSGENTFSGNTANGALNDIYNAGQLVIADNGTLTLDGGISGDGTASFGSNTTLNVKQGVTTIANKVSFGNGIQVLDANTTFSGTTVNVTLANGASNIDLNDIFTNTANTDKLDNMQLGTNSLYNFVQDEADASLYTAEKKSADDVAASLGVSGSEAAAVMAVASSSAPSGNAAFDNMAAVLNDAAQNGNGTAAQEASKLGADANPIVRTVETDLHNMVFSAVSDELNETSGAMAESKYQDAPFKRVKAWIRGLYNHVDKEATAKAHGFDANIYGVAMGIDKQLDRAVKLGVGYAYNQADISAHGRDTDVDTHTAFVYGQYKPSNWYVNTIVAYNWSDYDEKKSVLGQNDGAKYDVNSLGLQAMFGYESKLGSYNVTPEAGLRYAHISQDSYHDKLGDRIGSNDSDILTAVIGTKIAKNYALDRDTVIRPEIKAAVTYDLVDDGNHANVVLANGAAYRVDGEKLERLGFELGAKAAANVAENVEISAGYEVRFRKDYNDQTAMLEAKYNF